MRYRVNQVWARLVGRPSLERKKNVPGRGAEIYPDDVLIVSYPKSGNTWARFLIGNLTNPNDPLTFTNVESKGPSIYLSEDVLRRASRPRLLKSHEYFDPRYKKVVYIVRDPRDVAISYYHFLIKFMVLEEGYPLEEFVPRFVSGEMDSFGSWGENVGSWLGARGDDPNFLLLRYEDMLKDPILELGKVASFLSVSAPNAQIERSVELSSAERMRKLEKDHSFEGAKHRKDKAFIRAAQTGGWRNELPEVSVASIEKAWGRTMANLGYELQTKSAPIG